MLRVLDTKARPEQPTWLAGAADLQCRPCRDGLLWGIGFAVMLADDGPWFDIGDGYKVAGKQDPQQILRCSTWPTVACADLTGREWSAPAVLTGTGTRNFAVAFGRDWMPAPTPEQARAEQIAQEARAALTSGTDLPMPVCCQWAAELLAMTHHLTPEILGALCLLDEALVVQTLSVAAGLAEVGHG